MAWEPNFPFEPIPEGYFSGQRHITREDDDNPDLWELLNALRGADGEVKRGVETVPLAGSTAAVTFTTAFPAGTTVAVVLTVKGRNVTAWYSAESETGFTINLSAGGVDTDVAWIAFPV